MKALFLFTPDLMEKEVLINGKVQEVSGPKK
jgi:hypothetical protein